MLPFSASSDAENGRLSANFICHAPAPFDHAPADALLLPQATNRWAPTSLVPKRARLINRFNVTLHLHGGPKMASFSNPPAGLWPALSLHSYISPSNDPSTFCSFLFFFNMANSDRHFRSLYLSLFPSCYLLSGRSLNRLELSGSSYARSGQGPDHASSGTVQS